MLDADHTRVIGVPRRVEGAPVVEIETETSTAPVTKFTPSRTSRVKVY